MVPSWDIPGRESPAGNTTLYQVKNKQLIEDSLFLVETSDEMIDGHDKVESPDALDETLKNNDIFMRFEISNAGNVYDV